MLPSLDLPSAILTSVFKIHLEKSTAQEFWHQNRFTWNIISPVHVLGCPPPVESSDGSRMSKINKIEIEGDVLHDIAAF